MAVTKLLRIKESTSGRNKSSGLQACIDYICNPAKTDNYRLVTGNAGSDPDFIYSAMCGNKAHWSKENGSQGFHYVISFSPTEGVSKETAMDVAKDFCNELLGNDHIYAIAFHTDTPHPHCHIVFDSVNCHTGKMFHSGQYDWLARIQPITDSVCHKYGLSTLSFDPTKERKSAYHKEWEDARTPGCIKKDVSWNDVIRDDIDDCIAYATDWDDFLKRLEKIGYTINDGKYLSLKPQGRERPIRTARLGPDYTKESLQNRIGHSHGIKTEGRSYRTYGNSVYIFRAVYKSYYPGRTYSPLQRYFYRRFFFLFHIRRQSMDSGVRRYMQDVVNLGRLTDQVQYLFDHDITSSEEIRKRLAELSKQRGREASAERRICNGILKTTEERKSENEPEIPDYPLPTPDSIYQIRLNKILFGNADLTAETFTARIPGTEEFIRLYSDDSRSYNESQTISSYIYPEAEYQVEDADGNVIGRATGQAVKDRFKNREIERKPQPEHKTHMEEEQSWKRK